MTNKTLCKQPHTGPQRGDFDSAGELIADTVHQLSVCSVEGKCECALYSVSPLLPLFLPSGAGLPEIVWESNCSTPSPQ